MTWPARQRAVLAAALAVAVSGGLIRTAAAAPPTAAPPIAAPTAPSTAAPDLLVDAGAALDAGDPARAAALAERVARDPGPVDRPDRAEAWRILGLAQHALGRRDRAAASFYEYLKLDPDAHLDPALVAVDALSLFEEIRSQHAAELAALRRKPRRRRTPWLNLVPLGGQWQNGDRAKLWILGVTGAALLATNITSYAMLRRWCGSGSDGTCDEGEPGAPGYSNHVDAARNAQIINIASGVGLIALYTYSVFDGFRGYHRWRADEARRFQPAPVAVGVGADRDSLQLTVSGSF
ncbi:MAG TPA: tetratricopeptide repeat protein [Kofleriaceae bacterium]|nr:tetratricopeptide repeat protein [Kofleriaceae bacterium]